MHDRRLEVGVRPSLGRKENSAIILQRERRAPTGARMARNARSLFSRFRFGEFLFELVDPILQCR
jgi:hypothetical protein